MTIEIADRIRNVRFKPVRISEGYAMGEAEKNAGLLTRLLGRA